jgi:hypothetical protein
MIKLIYNFIEPIAGALLYLVVAFSLSYTFASIARLVH